MNIIYDQLSESDLQIVKEMIDFNKADIKKAKNSKDKLKGIFKIVDSYIHKFIEPISKCRKGCNFCCYINADISSVEAEILMPFVRESDIAQLKKQEGKDRNAYDTLSYQDRKCIFLEKGSCRVYENRPLACRKYHVVSDPELCNTENGVKIAQVVQNINIEILVNSFHMVHENKINFASWYFKIKK